MPPPGSDGSGNDPGVEPYDDYEIGFLGTFFDTGPPSFDGIPDLGPPGLDDPGSGGNGTQVAGCVPCAVAAPAVGDWILGGLILLGIIGKGVDEAVPQIMRQSGDRSIDNPSSLEGATPEEVEEAAREAGFTERGDPPRNDPNGARLRKPGNTADQVQSGNPADSNPVKQGPYVRISQGGRVSDPIPLAGNPTLP